MKQLPPIDWVYALPPLIFLLICLVFIIYNTLSKNPIWPTDNAFTDNTPKATEEDLLKEISNNLPHLGTFTYQITAYDNNLRLFLRITQGINNGFRETIHDKIYHFEDGVKTTTPVLTEVLKILKEWKAQQTKKN